MIKNGKRFFIKCFGILLFVLFGFGVNSSFATEYIPYVGFNMYSPRNVLQDKNKFGEMTYTIDTVGNFTTVYNGVSHNYLYFIFNENKYQKYLVIGWKNGQLYGFIGDRYGSNTSFRTNIQGYFSGYAIIESGFQFNSGNNTTNIPLTLDWIEASNYLSSNNILGLHGSNKNDSSNAGNINSAFYGYFFLFAHNYNSSFCLITDNEESPYLCFWKTCFDSNSSCYNTPNLTGSLDFTPVSWDSPASWDSFFNESSPIVPGNVSSSTVIYSNTDLDKVISYYETRYGRNESMCYVGTFDTGSSYGTPGIDFVSGTGNSVFGLYHELYNSYGDNIIKNVGSWINVRLINYSERFYNNDNMRYLASYNGPDSNISLYYTGLTFPFANKPVALYFMASNLYDGYSRESTQGEEMSYYCYSKLNYQQINDGDIDYTQIQALVSTGINQRLDTYYNYHIVNNSGSYITPSSGSFWDAFGTGYEETDLDLDTTFSDFFDKITSFFANYSPSYSTGIIPDWILYPLIFLILFRIMKH